MSDARKGRVLIVVENLPVPFDRRVWLEATTLRAAGYEVSVICPKGKGHVAEYEQLDGVSIYRHDLPEEGSGALGYLREYTAALYWQFRLARRVWRERGFDVVHICNPPDVMFLLAGWYKFTRGVRVIFDHHDVNPELYVEKFGRKDFFYRALVLLEKLTMRTADVVISTNESYRRIAVERGRKRPEEVFVVRSAPPLERFRRLPLNEEHKFGHRYLVGYVGIMAEQDGVDYLVRAAHEVARVRGRDDIGFLLVGGGTSLPKLQALAEELGVAEHVRFAGFRTGDELLEMLSAVDVAVAPDPISPYNDVCTMNKVLEYMALGIPIVQFDLREGRASAGEAAVYVPKNDHKLLADQVLRLLDDPEARSRMGAVGMDRMRTRLSWELQAPRLLEAYAAVLARR